MKLTFGRKKETFAGIQMRGSRPFLRRTKESLVLLQSSGRFAIVQENLAVIRQGQRSGVKAWAERPTFIVGKPTWSHSALWFAGAIAHDAYHAKLYRDAKKHLMDKEPDAEAWTGIAAEKSCLAFQREVLNALNADQKIITYIAECEENPTYQGRNSGWGSWLDYLRRWW